MSKPLVSVIVAVRNGERYLADALQSIFAQDYHPFEVIVVDGQSTDNTAAIAKSFQSVRYLSQMGQGIADAYNTGIDAAQGDFIAFLSHDDLWTPNKLSVQMDFMLCHPEIQYTIAKAKFFLEKGHSIPPTFKSELLKGEHVARIMETLVVRKTLFDQIGKFDPELTVAEDVDWYARTNDHNVQMSIIPTVLLYKRVHNTNISLNTSNQYLLKALRRSIKRKQL
jgi:glycosyltransferase involved in cell wall biosynthesis